MADFTLTNTASEVDDAIKQIKDSGTDLNIDSNTLVVDKSENRVGIGTTSPDTKLQIEVSPSDGNATIGLMEDNSSGAEVEYDGTGNAFNINTGTGGGGNLTTRLSIARDSGNVGIGTISPNTNLHVLSSDTPTIKIQDTTNDRVLTLDVDNTNAKIQAGTGSGLLFRTNGSNNRMFIDSSGNVGIGTTQPGADLEVNGVIASKGGAGLSVASFTITATHNYHQVDTSGGAETVQTINGGVAGMILILKNANFNDLTFEDGIGNLRCASNSDVILNDNNSTITFIHDGGNWLQVATSDNS